MPVKVLFVCLGNICRSPTAHGVFVQRVAGRGLAEHIEIDSAGTGGWHIGNSPDKRSQRAAAARGYDLSLLRARQVAVDDFYTFDYILAMDKQNLTDLLALAPTDGRANISLFLPYARDLTESEVPDPYYGGQDGFGHVLDLVERASESLLDQLIQTHKLQV